MVQNQKTRSDFVQFHFMYEFFIINYWNITFSELTQFCFQRKKKIPDNLHEKNKLNKQKNTKIEKISNKIEKIIFTAEILISRNKKKMYCYIAMLIHISNVNQYSKHKNVWNKLVIKRNITSCKSKKETPLWNVCILFSKDNGMKETCNLVILTARDKIYRQINLIKVDTNYWDTQSKSTVKDKHTKTI